MRITACAGPPLQAALEAPRKVKMNNDTLFVLGASDPEMEEIRNLLASANCRYAHAMAAGRRVHPGNAYAADSVSADFGRPATVVWVECGPAPDSTMAACVQIMADDGVVFDALDHHRPGDAGFGAPPGDYMMASSLGQVIAAVAAYLPWHKHRATLIGAAEDGCLVKPTRSWQGVWLVEGDQWSVACDWSHALQIPHTLQLVAAADHCLRAAYAGKCPGVDPTELRAWREASRAEFQGRTVDAVRADVEAACRELSGRDRSSGWVDFGGETVPELPEAGAITGIGYVATVTDRDGRRKRVFSGAPEQVAAWMRVEGAQLTGVYGDPARGFAGGYFP